MPKILYVKPQAEAARGPVNALKTQGFDVQVLSDFERIREVCKTTDLVIVQMPQAGTDGLDLQEIRRACGFRDVPLLALCDQPKPGEMPPVEAAHASSTAYLPIEAPAFLERVQSSLKPVGKKSQVDVRIINVFIQSISEAFLTLANCTPRKVNVILKKDYKMLGDVSGFIGLSGTTSGSVVISFPLKLAFGLVSKILQEPVETMSVDMVCDGVGEMANIVVGRAKTLLVNLGFQTRISVPSVVQGPGHEIHHPKDTPCIVIIFEADGHQFALQVAMNQLQGDETPAA